MKYCIIFSAALAALAFTGCGTVSHVTSTPGVSLDMTRYDRVLVQDFADGATAQANARDQARRKAELAVATKAFPDRIAIELGAKNAFREVTRAGTPDAQTLVISGTITRYTEGDTALRLWVGLGAGSSYFDAMVEFRDGSSTNLLATQKVDKNSWGGGGAIASSQTPEEFMREAAKRLAEDLASLKSTGKIPGAGSEGGAPQKY